MVWMYLVSLFGFSFAILSMAEMSSMYVLMGGTPCRMTMTDKAQGSYVRRTISVSCIHHNPGESCARSHLHSKDNINGGFC